MAERKNKRRPKGAGCIMKIGKKYYLQVYVNDKKIKKSLHTENKQEADKKAKEILSDLHSKTKAEFVTKVAEIKKFTAKDNVKLDNMWEMFKKSPLRNQSTEEGTLKIYKNTLDKFMTWKSGAYPNINSLSDLTVNIASEFAKWLGDIGFAGDTYNRHIKNMSTMTGVLMKKAEINDNVWLHIKRKDNRGIGKKKLSEEELIKLMDSFSDIKLMQKEQMEIMFYIGILTGMRLADCALLKWENVDFERGLIVLIPQKIKRSGTHIKVPIHHDLYVKLLYAGEKWEYTGYVIPDVAERYLSNPSGVKKDAVKVFDHAGFETTVDAPNGTQRLMRVNQYGFHSLRHTFISECASRGMMISTLSEITGDKIKTLEKYYIEINENVIKESAKFITSVKPANELNSETKMVVPAIESTEQ